MKGVHIRKAFVVHNDERRNILEIMNGQLDIRNLKILEVKEDSYLGGQTGHFHLYPEVMFIYKGSCKNYVMTNIDTDESESFDLGEGDIVFRTGRIIHGGDFKKGTVVIDGSCQTYVSADFNDCPRELVE